jgi:dihydroorotate dehydrogenase electron transfer subunit
MEENRITVCQAEVVSNAQKAKDIWELKLDPGDDFDVTAIMPGQFVCLAPLDPSSTMARPFSVATISVSRNTFSLLYKAAGKNTELMTKLPQGEKVKFWGPLGQGFLPDSTTYDEVWLVGGGIGVAPLIYYEKAISELQGGIARVFYGNRTREEIIPLDLYTQEPLALTTDDGSEGHKGFVTDILADFVKAAMGQKILVITCGPNIMMAKVAEICQQADIECYVILETIMACGLNNCKGCTIKTTAGMKSVCHDGPVFLAKEVIWDELA